MSAAYRTWHHARHADETCASCPACYLRNGACIVSEDCATCLGTGCTSDEHREEYAESIGGCSYCMVPHNNADDFCPERAREAAEAWRDK